MWPVTSVSLQLCWCSPPSSRYTLWCTPLISNQSTSPWHQQDILTQRTTTNYTFSLFGPFFHHTGYWDQFVKALTDIRYQSSPLHPLKSCVSLMINAGVIALGLKSCLLGSVYNESALQDRLNSSWMAVDWSTQGVSSYNNAPSNMTWQDTENKSRISRQLWFPLFLIHVTGHCSN